MAATYNVLAFKHEPENGENRVSSSSFFFLSSARLAPLREQCRDQNTHEQ